MLALGSESSISLQTLFKLTPSVENLNIKQGGIYLIEPAGKIIPVQKSVTGPAVSPLVKFPQRPIACPKIMHIALMSNMAAKDNFLTLQ